MEINLISNEIKTVQALSPENQSVWEKRAILEDMRFADLLHGEGISEIRKIPGGYTVITTDGREISIRVVYIPSGIGPRKFELIFD